MLIKQLIATLLKKRVTKKTDVIIYRAKDYYKNGKERLREQARGKYRNSSEEEKNEKRKCGRNRYHMSKEKKTKTKRISKKLPWG